MLTKTSPRTEPDLFESFVLIPKHTADDKIEGSCSNSLLFSSDLKIPQPDLYEVVKRDGLEIGAEYLYEDSEIARLLDVYLQEQGFKTSQGKKIFHLGPADREGYPLSKVLESHERKEGIVLLPYQAGKHWVGLILEYNADGNLIDAAYFNSIEVPGVPDYLDLDLMTHSHDKDERFQFRLITPQQGLILQNNIYDCGPCAVDNLLGAVGYREARRDMIDRRVAHILRLQKAGDLTFYQSFYERQRCHKKSAFGSGVESLAPR